MVSIPTASLGASLTVFVEFIIIICFVFLIFVFGLLYYVVEVCLLFWGAFYMLFL